MTDTTATAAPGNARYHHGDLPAALLSAVGTLIERDGIGAVSLRAAAREVGVSHAAPAHHFGDKRGMLTAFACEGYAAFSAALAHAWQSAPADDPRAGLRSLGAAYVAFARDRRAYYEVMFRPELAESETMVTDDDPDDPDDAFRVIQLAVAANLEDAEPDEPRVLQLTLVAWCTIHGLVQLWFDGPLRHMVDGPLRHFSSAGGTSEPSADHLTLEALEQRCADALADAIDAERDRGLTAARGSDQDDEQR